MFVDLQSDIEMLDLSNRTKNALRKNNVNTLQDLLILTDILPEEELAALSGIGTTAIREIRTLLTHTNVTKALETRAEANADIPRGLGLYWRKIQPIDRSFHVLVDYYNGGSSITLQELSTTYQVSRERIRQIIAKGTERLRCALVSGTVDGDFLKELDEYARKRTEVRAIKITDDDVFTTTGIVYLVSSFKSAKYKVYTNKDLNGKWLVLAEDNVGKVMEILIDELKHRSAPMLISDIEKMYSIGGDMVMSIKGIVEKNGYVTHEKNKIATGTDRNHIITRYLEAINRPASISEIANNTILSNNQVRGAICDKKAYINVGRSIYDTVDHDYSNLSVADLAVNILTAEDRALKTSIVLEYVRRYKVISESGASLAFLKSPKLRERDGYLFLSGWTTDKKEKKKSSNYSVMLEDAVLGIINRSDEIFNFEKVHQELLKRYGNTVSTNLNSIKATLISLANKDLIIRIGGARTGCYVRSRAKAPTGEPTNISTVRTMATLGSFVHANMGKQIEIRYKTQRKNSDNRWRVISVKGQDAIYIYTNDLNAYGYRVKYRKDKVVEYRKLRVTGNSEDSQKDDDVDFYQCVADYVDKLGNIFTLAQLYKFEKELAKKLSPGENVRKEIEKQVQAMRWRGVVRMILPGVYRKNNDFSNEAITKDLVAGREYENSDLVNMFGVSFQGGMRKSNRTNSLVLIAKHIPGNPYDDKWEGDHMEYTGMGLRGDQSVDYMQNKTLAESKSNGVTVYLFESYTNNSYLYRGVVELDGEPYYEKQKDELGHERKVVKFSLKLVKK